MKISAVFLAGQFVDCGEGQYFPRHERDEHVRNIVQGTQDFSGPIARSAAVVVRRRTQSRTPMRHCDWTPSPRRNRAAEAVRLRTLPDGPTKQWTWRITRRMFDPTRAGDWTASRPTRVAGVRPAFRTTGGRMQTDHICGRPTAPESARAACTGATREGRRRTRN